MVKSSRNYILEVQSISGEMITIKLPFTIEFDIQKTLFSSTNVGSIRVYNLSKSIRTQIRKDQFVNTLFRKVTLRAGYNGEYPIIFTGNITQAWSYREGVNLITEIQANDAGLFFIKSVTNLVFPKGTSKKKILSDIVTPLEKQYGVSLGAVGSFDGSLTKGESYSGNTGQILRDITGNAFFIDNGKIHFLKTEETLDTEELLISAETGLLGTPLKEQTIVHVNMLFEPRLLIGQKVKVNSSTATDGFNGSYKVQGIHHRATISEAVSGDAITSLGLLDGTFKNIPELNRG